MMDVRYEGGRNQDGEPHGRGTMWMGAGDDDENRYEGRFVRGCRSGWGTMFFGSDGLCSLRGFWQDDELQGVGVYTDDDGSTREAQFKDGVPNGPGVERDSAGNVEFRGIYFDGMRSEGTEWLDDGGMLCGTWKSDRLHGDSCYYRYPNVDSDDPTDLSGGALYGLWEEGIMIKAKYIQSLGSAGSTNNSTTFHEAQCDRRLKPCDNMQLRDPYETATVTVKVSTIGENSGEGLFAVRNIAMGQLCAVYAGIHLTHGEVDGRDWEANDNTITLDDEVVIDVPPQYASLDKYSASLGHKANHNSPNNNAEYAPLYHPRFGYVKSIVAIKDISPGEEITVDYGYDDVDGSKNHGVPQWYRDFMQHNK